MLEIARSHTLSNSLQRARPNKWKNKNKAPPNSPETGCEQPIWTKTQVLACHCSFHHFLITYVPIFSHLKPSFKDDFLLKPPLSRGLPHMFPGISHDLYSMDWFSRENRNRKPSIFPVNIWAFPVNVPWKPIYWYFVQSRSNKLALATWPGQSVWSRIGCPGIGRATSGELRRGGGGERLGIWWGIVWFP